MDHWGHFDLAKMGLCSFSARFSFIHSIAVIDQISPTFIITSSKSDVQFIQAIRDFRTVKSNLCLTSRRIYSPIRPKVDSHPSPPKFLIRPKKEFNYHIALERLLSLELLLGERNNDKDQNPQFRWAARVRLNNFSNVELCSGGVSMNTL